MPESESLTLADGRILTYAVYGASTTSKVVFYFHAFPSSRLEGRIWHDAALKLGTCLVVPDRPEMGNATFQPNRTLLDYPIDILALADHLQIERFYTIGLSGGGPYAFACVRGIPKERLLGASVLSGMYPISLGTGGMMMRSRILLWLAPWAPGLMGFLFDKAMGDAARNGDPKVFEDMILQDIETRPQKDREAFTDPRFKGDFIEATREGLRQGSQGMAWEASMNGSPWGFEFDELDPDIPLTLWHAEADINCPAAMAKKAKENLPRANLKLIGDDEGHVSYFWKNQDEILKELLDRSE
jgi:pimeloyl-ACP methyl ester carboxylesterase